MKFEEDTVVTNTKKQGFGVWLKSGLAKLNLSFALKPASIESDPSGIQTVGRYEIIQKIGNGSMGIVFLAEDPYIKRQVALKIAQPGTALSGSQITGYRERFFLEAQSAGRLMHPNIVAIYDAGLQDEFCYIAMEYIDGKTLMAHCQKGSLLSINRAIEIVYAVCTGLDYAHKLGVIHRDIKPSNILLDRVGHVKVADFGIAHIKSAETSPNGIVGTPFYMSPEQVNEEPVDNRSDIFSLGCVLYELLTGEQVFAGDNLFSIFYNVMNKEPESIRRIRPEIPDILERITRKALAKDPADRYQSCLDMAFDLRVVLRGLKGTVRHEKIGDMVDYVHHVSFFKGFTKEQVREILAVSDIVRVDQGEVVMQEGEIDDSFYILLSGSVGVKKGNRFIAFINPGECFGEMSYLSGQSRSATIAASMDCTLLKISSTILDRSPESIQLLFMKQFAMTLMGRLLKSKTP